MTRLSILALIPAAALAGDLGGLWPWANQSPDPPPNVPPYEIPTFDGKARDFRKTIDWVKAPRVDGDAIFRTIVNCYPSRSRWRIQVDLETSLKNSEIHEVTGTAMGRYYVGVVARMPLYSADDHDREREREYRRRQDTAALIADYVAGIAARNKAVRNLSLAAAMEQRTRVRVAEGIADAEEQVKYLQAVAANEDDLIRAEAQIMKSRLALVSMCRDEVVNEVNAYLTRLSQLPEDAKP